MIAMVAIGLVSATVGLGSASATVHFPSHRCGHFVVDNSEYEDVLTVYNSKGLSCSLATEVIEAFWNPGEAHHHHGGRSEVQSWYTTDQFPQWRCFSGAGAAAVGTNVGSPATR
jgi:hypothetical protein